MTPTPPQDPARSRPHAPRLDRRTLRGDLRRLAADTTAGLLVTGVFFALLYRNVASGASPTLEVMPHLADAPGYWLYWLCQAFGWSALLWSWVSVLLGLARAMRPLRVVPVSHARLEVWHRVTGITAIALMFGHIAAFFAELVRANEDGLAPAANAASAAVDTFVPGGYATGTGQTAILLGLIAFYLAIPLGLSFYLRSWTGTRLWRVLHRFVIAVYVLSVWHTLLYGTNVWFEGWFRTAVWATQLPVALLLLARLLAPLRTAEHLARTDLGRGARPSALFRGSGRLLAALGVLALLFVTVSGLDGGRARGADAGELLVTEPMIWGGLAVLLTVMAAVALAVRTEREERSGAAPEPGTGAGAAGDPPPRGSRRR
ncbi:ferric reductase-like transmembrane domain-containing protein [Nocardiopsis coralliicola]